MGMMARVILLSQRLGLKLYQSGHHFYLGGPPANAGKHIKINHFQLDSEHSSSMNRQRLRGGSSSLSESEGTT
jgi:hypothetical protein